MKESLMAVGIGVLNFLVVVLVVWFMTVVVQDKPADYDRIMIESGIILTVITSGRLTMSQIKEKD